MSFPPSFAPSSVGKESACNAEVRTWVLFLDREDPLEKEMATHSNILAWGIPWTEEPCGLRSMGSQESDTTEWISLHYMSFRLFNCCFFKMNIKVIDINFKNSKNLSLRCSHLYLMKCHFTVSLYAMIYFTQKEVWNVLTVFVYIIIFLLTRDPPIS